MTPDKAHLNNFVKSLFEDDFAKAKDDLQQAVVEKLKARMASEVISTPTESKKDKGE